jgi:WD40 repeat protein
MDRDYAPQPEFSADSRWFIMCLMTNAVLMVDLHKIPDVSPPSPPSKAILDPAGGRIAIALDDKLTIHQLDPPANLADYQYSARIEDVTWHPDGERVAAALSDGKVMIADLRTRTSLQLDGHSVNAVVVNFHPKGEILASASWDGTTRFWDAGTGRALFLTREGIGLGFDGAGSRMAFIREGSGFGIWKVVAPIGFSKLACPLKTTGRMVAVDFHADGRHLVCGDEQAWYIADSEAGSILHRQSAQRLRSIVLPIHRSDHPRRRRIRRGEFGLSRHGVC